jgi:hypothetical protein
VDSFFHDLFNHLELSNVTSQEMEFIKNQTSRGRTPHSTFETHERKKVEKELMENKLLLRKIIRMYYYDFVLFGFEIPSCD